MSSLNDLTAALAVTAALVGCLMPAWVTAAESPYSEGERVLITGVVRTPDGRPADKIQVTLQASRQKLSLRNLRRQDTDHRQINTFTNDQGRYTLEWIWYDFYNHFELFAGRTATPSKLDSDGPLEVLARLDLTRQMERGGPISEDLVLTAGETQASDVGLTAASPEGREAPEPERPRTAHPPAESYRAADPSTERGSATRSSPRTSSARASRFVSGLSSDDEHRIYDRFGQPDTVKRFRYPEYLEVSWWYFREGKAYTFRDGRLERDFDFDPVVPF